MYKNRERPTIGLERELSKLISEANRVDDEIKFTKREGHHDPGYIWTFFPMHFVTLQSLDLVETFHASSNLQFLGSI